MSWHSIRYPIRRQPQHGVALLAAIFLLVVLSALALYMASLSGTQHFTSMWALQGARAHYAAQSGLQWGASQARNSACPATATLTIDAFSVQVSCTSAGNFQELSVTRTVWTIDAHAQSTGLAVGSPGYVQRRQRATVIQ
jgi:MSHA biogenesis protein MshP